MYIVYYVFPDNCKAILLHFVLDNVIYVNSNSYFSLSFSSEVTIRMKLELTFLSCGMVDNIHVTPLWEKNRIT